MKEKTIIRVKGLNECSSLKVLDYISKEVNYESAKALDNFLNMVKGLVDYINRVREKQKEKKTIIETFKDFQFVEFIRVVEIGERETIWGENLLSLWMKLITSGAKKEEVEKWGEMKQKTNKKMGSIRVRKKVVDELFEGLNEFGSVKIVELSDWYYMRLVEYCEKDIIGGVNKIIMEMGKYLKEEEKTKLIFIRLKELFKKLVGYIELISWITLEIVNMQKTIMVVMLGLAYNYEVSYENLNDEIIKKVPWSDSAIDFIKGINEEIDEIKKENKKLKTTILSYENNKITDLVSLMLLTFEEMDILKNYNGYQEDFIDDFSFDLVGLIFELENYDRINNLKSLRTLKDSKVWSLEDFKNEVYGFGWCSHINELDTIEDKDEENEKDD